MSLIPSGLTRRLVTFAVLVSLAGGTLQIGGSASTSEAGAGYPDDCVLEYVHAVGDVCRLPNGLLQVTLPDGHVGTTHGADPAPPGDHGDDLDADERRPLCATGNVQHVLYGHHADQPDRYDQVVETFRTTIRKMNWVLNEDALETGGITADYKILCDDMFRIQVDRFTVPGSSSSFSDVVSAARNAGFNDGKKDYTIFFDGTQSGVCGVGHISGDDRPGAENWNNRGGDYGVTYKNCWSGRTAMHENGHNQGAVQVSAPDSDGSWHCRKGADVMCYPPYRDIMRFCIDRVHFDCQHDSYFHADPELGSYLDEHWNIGSPVNRFIAFDTAQDDNEDPHAAFDATVDGDTVTVDASPSTDPEGATLDHAWSFGEGPKVRGETASYTYDAPGRYRITLWVSDGVGGIDQVTQEVTVRPDVPARIEEERFDGRIACSAAVALVATVDHCAARGIDDEGARQDFAFTVDPGVRSMRVTIAWDAASAAGGGLLGAETMAYSWQAPPGLGGASGTAPLVQEDLVDPASAFSLYGGDARISVRPDGASGLVADQSFRVCIDIMYGDAETPDAVDCV